MKGKPKAKLNAVLSRPGRFEVSMMLVVLVEDELMNLEVMVSTVVTELFGELPWLVVFGAAPPPRGVTLGARVMGIRRLVVVVEASPLSGKKHTIKSTYALHDLKNAEAMNIYDILA